MGIRGLGCCKKAWPLCLASKEGVVFGSLWAIVCLYQRLGWFESMVKTYGMGKPLGCIVVASCGSVMHDKRRGSRGLHGVCVCVKHWVIVVLFGTGRKCYVLWYTHI